MQALRRRCTIAMSILKLWQQILLKAENSAGLSRKAFRVPHTGNVLSPSRWNKL